MDTSDELARRMYNNQVVRHQAGANTEFASIQSRVESLASAIRGGEITIALGSAKNLACEVADLVSYLSALETLNNVECLLVRQDTDEHPAAESTEEKP